MSLSKGPLKGIKNMYDSLKPRENLTKTLVITKGSKMNLTCQIL